MAVNHDDRTGRGYPLPHPDNFMRDDANPADGDIMRLRAAIQKISDDIEDAETLALALGD